MAIYMTHPQHGAMHVYAEAEALANEKNGWVRTPDRAPDNSQPTEEHPWDAGILHLPVPKRGVGRPRKEV